MQIPKTLLTDLGVSAAHADTHLGALNELMPRHGIDSPLRVTHFLAQVLHESAHLKAVSENLNYSVDGLLRVFPRYFKTPAQAAAYARQPERIGNRVYGGRLGNGNEASGDGYRYRGRGLMQLTGKANYQDFSRWLGQDCVAAPDLVAERFAAASAVFFWDRNGLNALADTDNLKAVTQRVNGGLNGFAERRALLEKAKRGLRALNAAAGVATVEAPFRPTHRVTSTELNLRRAPQVSPTNLIAPLPQGTRVEEQEADRVTEGWAKVRVLLSGVLREGFVAARFLGPLPRGILDFALTTASSPTDWPLPPAELGGGHQDATRARDGGRIYRLDEPGRPKLTGAAPTTRARQLNASIDWLDCEDPEHRRYRPKPGANFASTYCCDYAGLAGVYLPRVWWTSPALVRLSQGIAVEATYGSTVREVCTNALYDWLLDYGNAFGWQREIDLINLQEAANAGEVCIIIAKARGQGRAGQVVAVLPEQEGAQARRDAAGDVLRPVQSYCGPKNVRRATARSAWWLSGKFHGYAFWRHGD